MKCIIKKSLVLISLLALFTIWTNASSARTIENYNFNLPRFVSSSQTNSVKKTSATSAVNNNSFIGGNYTMYSRMYAARDGSFISGERTQKSGDRIYIKYYDAESEKGNYVFSRMWTGWTVRVKVIARGTWSPDSK